MVKLHTKLMEYKNTPLKYWSLYADVTCDNCDKTMSLAYYKSNGSKCIRCGHEIKL